MITTHTSDIVREEKKMALVSNSVGTGKPATGTATQYRYSNLGKDTARAKELAKTNNVDVASMRQRALALQAQDQTPTYTPTKSTAVNTSTMDSAYSSTNDNIVNQIKSLLDEQKKQADEYYKTLYEQQIAQNKQAYRANQDQINLNRVRGRNYINQLYGDVISGPGISNRVRNDLNWASNSASNRLNYTNNDASALASYNSGLANNASTLAQGWYNYVLPVYTNRQQTEDDYAYRRYLATL